MKTIIFLMAMLLTLSFMSCNAQKNDKKIDVAALPAVAQKLIKSNFADEQIKAVEQDDDGYEVKCLTRISTLQSTSREIS